MASAYIDPCVVVPPQTTLDPYEITTGTQQVTSLTHTILDAHTHTRHTYNQIWLSGSPAIKDHCPYQVHVPKTDNTRTT